MKNFKISIVDDNEFCLHLYKQMLESVQVTNITTFSTSNGFLNSLTTQPDIVFLDYQIDNLTGLEILKKIKRFNPEIFVILISGQEAISVAVTALKFGAFDYLIKDQFGAAELELLLKKIEKLKKLIKQKESKSILHKIKSSITK
ncbi:MAG: response regulator [Chitinophagaceae bacterium]|nr:response regulator [Chitinophagaceae bacterium]